jgi:hypothetical protein
MKRQFRETDLYGPLRGYLEAQGYSVRGEVQDCDLTATKGDELIVIELKRRFDTQLLIKAARRQRAADSVYVAVPRPGSRESRSRWRGIRHLLRRLELGLIFVSPGRHSRIEIVFHPLSYRGQRNRPARTAILREIAGRSGDYNLGGSTGRPIVTAYRENCIFVATCLAECGPLAPRALRALGTGEKTLSILASNFYGWFDRVAHGVYALKEAGRAAQAQYPELVEHYRRRLGAQPAATRTSGAPAAPLPASQSLAG